MHLSAHRHILLLRDKMVCISILVGAARLRATRVSYALGKARSQPAAGRWAGRLGSASRSVAVPVFNQRSATELKPLTFNPPCEQTTTQQYTKGGYAQINSLLRQVCIS
jgi:hypothetical protein